METKRAMKETSVIIENADSPGAVVFAAGAT